MPGVPPDALAQVKKGLRGLFNRKKSKASQQQSEPESTSRELPTNTGAAPAPPATAARAGEGTKNGDYAQPAEAPTSSPAHHISEPSGVEEAKAVDLNPTTDVNTATTEPAKVDEGKLEPVATSGIKAEPSTGMSATSGPLGDHMAEVYQEVDHTEEEGTSVEGGAVKGAETT